MNTNHENIYPTPARVIQSLPTLASHIGLLSPPMRTRPPGEAQEVWWYLDIYISTHIYTYLHISTHIYRSRVPLVQQGVGGQPGASCEGEAGGSGVGGGGAVVATARHQS